jgi:hypothetical protein
MNTGGCLCGAIRFGFETKDIAGARCYCRDCQYVSGGEPAAVLRIPVDALTVEGEPVEYRSLAASGAEVFRSFCPTCGTPLFAGNARHAGYIVVKAGALDDPSIFRSRLVVWPQSAQPWHTIDETLPTFSGGGE